MSNAMLRGLDAPAVPREGQRTLLDLPPDVLSQVLLLLTPSKGHPPPWVADKLGELAAFHAVSKAARRAADAAGELLVYDTRPLLSTPLWGRLSDEQRLQRLGALLLADLARWPNAARVHVLFTLPKAWLRHWLTWLADAGAPHLAELHVYLLAPGAPLQLPACLARLAGLQRLSLSGVHVSQACVDALAGLPRLRCLALERTRFQGQLPPMPGLQVFSITQAIYDSALRLSNPLFELWTSLSALSICNSRLKGDARTWKLPPSLLSLNLESIRGCQALDYASARQLRELQLYTLGGITIGCLPRLPVFRSVRRLSVEYGDRLFSGLEVLTQLEELSLASLDLHRELELETLTNLHTLSLSDVRLPSHPKLWLVPLPPSLRALTVWNEPGLPGLAVRLSQCPLLERVRVQSPGLLCDGEEWLRGLSRMREIVVGSMPRSRRDFCGTGSLRRLTLWGEAPCASSARLVEQLGEEMQPLLDALRAAEMQESGLAPGEASLLEQPLPASARLPKSTEGPKPRWSTKWAWEVWDDLFRVAEGESEEEGEADETVDESWGP